MKFRSNRATQRSPRNHKSERGTRTLANQAELESRAPDLQPRFRILVIEPDLQRGAAIRQHLEQRGFDTLHSSNGTHGWTTIRRRRPHAVIASLNLANPNPLELLEKINSSGSIPVLFQAAAPQLAAVVAAIKHGARDVVAASSNLKSIVLRIEALLTSRSHVSRAEIEKRVIGNSQCIRRLRQRIHALANVRVPLLVFGETGSERDQIVEVLHATSPEYTESLAFFCATHDLTPSLREASVVYLRDIHEFSPAAQAYWLQSISRLKEQDATPRRIYASTTMNLETMASIGQFDPRLASIISQFKIVIPPIRKRPQDLRHLVQSLALGAAQDMGGRSVNFTPAAIAALRLHSWPQNMQELKFAIEKLVAFAAGGRITRDQVRSVLDESPTSVASMRRAGDERRRLELVKLLEETGGNLAEAARRSGVSRGSIIYRAQRFGLLPRRSRTR
ncbi:MAG: sigma 54-interacting transcriptional regulator [Myxococcales bacterium]|nr:sigma 54-interacting transcriptional regulator [Myxococcales bacterium]